MKNLDEFYKAIIAGKEDSIREFINDHELLTSTHPQLRLTPLQLAILQNHPPNIWSLLKPKLASPAEYCPFTIILKESIELEEIDNDLIAPEFGIVINSTKAISANHSKMNTAIENEKDEKVQNRLCLYIQNCSLLLKVTNSFNDKTAPSSLLKLYELLKGETSSLDFAATAFLLGKFYYHQKSYETARKYFHESAGLYEKNEYYFHAMIAYQFLGESNFFIEVKKVDCNFENTLKVVIALEKIFKKFPIDQGFHLLTIFKIRKEILYTAIYLKKIVNLKLINSAVGKTSVIQFEGINPLAFGKEGDTAFQFYKIAFPKQQKILEDLQKLTELKQLKKIICQTICLFFYFTTNGFPQLGYSIYWTIFHRKNNWKKDFLEWLGFHVEILFLFSSKWAFLDAAEFNDQTAILEQLEDMKILNENSKDSNNPDFVKSGLYIVACLVVSFRHCLPKYYECLDDYFGSFYRIFLKYLLSNEDFTRGTKKITQELMVSAKLHYPALTSLLQATVAHAHQLLIASLDISIYFNFVLDCHKKVDHILVSHKQIEKKFMLISAEDAQNSYLRASLWLMLKLFQPEIYNVIEDIKKKRTERPNLNIEVLSAGLLGTKLSNMGYGINDNPFILAVVNEDSYIKEYFKYFLNDLTVLSNNLPEGSPVRECYWEFHKFLTLFEKVYTDNEKNQSVKFALWKEVTFDKSKAILLYRLTGCMSLMEKLLVANNKNLAIFINEVLQILESKLSPYFSVVSLLEFKTFLKTLSSFVSAKNNQLNWILEFRDDDTAILVKKSLYEIYNVKVEIKNSSLTMSYDILTKDKFILFQNKVRALIARKNTSQIADHIKPLTDGKTQQNQLQNNNQITWPKKKKSKKNKLKKKESIVAPSFWSAVESEELPERQNVEPPSLKEESVLPEEPKLTTNNLSEASVEIVKNYFENSVEPDVKEPWVMQNSNFLFPEGQLRILYTSNKEQFDKISEYFVELKSVCASPAIEKIRAIFFYLVRITIVLIEIDYQKTQQLFLEFDLILKLRNFICHRMEKFLIGDFELLKQLLAIYQKYVFAYVSKIINLDTNAPIFIINLLSHPEFKIINDFAATRPTSLLEDDCSLDKLTLLPNIEKCLAMMQQEIAIISVTKDPIELAMAIAHLGNLTRIIAIRPEEFPKLSFLAMVKLGQYPPQFIEQLMQLGISYSDKSFLILQLNFSDVKLCDYLSDTKHIPAYILLIMCLEFRKILCHQKNFSLSDWGEWLAYIKTMVQHLQQKLQQINLQDVIQNEKLENELQDNKIEEDTESSENFVHK